MLLSSIDSCFYPNHIGAYRANPFSPFKAGVLETTPERPKEIVPPL